MCDIYAKQNKWCKKCCSLNHKVPETTKEWFTTKICGDTINFFKKNDSNNLANIPLDDDVLKTSSGHLSSSSSRPLDED